MKSLIFVISGIFFLGCSPSEKLVVDDFDPMLEAMEEMEVKNNYYDEKVFLNDNDQFFDFCMRDNSEL